MSQVPASVARIVVPGLNATATARRVLRGERYGASDSASLAAQLKPHMLASVRRPTGPQSQTHWLGIVPESSTGVTTRSQAGRWRGSTTEPGRSSEWHLGKNTGSTSMQNSTLCVSQNLDDPENRVSDVRGCFLCEGEAPAEPET